MAIRIQNITDEAHQRHIVLQNDQEVVVVLRYLSPAERWSIDVEYGDRAAYGYCLALNVLHMTSQNFPFDFIVEDTTGRGVDPFRLDDFSEGRCALYMLEAADMEEIRGQSVPV